MINSWENSMQLSLSQSLCGKELLVQSQHSSAMQSLSGFYSLPVLNLFTVYMANIFGSSYSKAEHRSVWWISACADTARTQSGLPRKDEGCLQKRPSQGLHWSIVWLQDKKNRDFLRNVKVHFQDILCFCTSRSLRKWLALYHRELCPLSLWVALRNPGYVFPFVTAVGPQVPWHLILGLSFPFSDDLMSQTATMRAFFLAHFSYSKTGLGYGSAWLPASGWQ